MGLKSNKNK